MLMLEMEMEGTERGKGTDAKKVMGGKAMV
jgi:hypothetical protein